jgi:hypothetical protein
MSVRVCIAFVIMVASSPLLVEQERPPHFMYIYRDSLKRGVDSAYRAIEEEAAQICVDLGCPNPYVALESLSGPHEVWWINTFAGEADTSRVVKAYAANAELMKALGAIPKRKATLIGKPIEGYAVYRRDLSDGSTWSVAGTRFMAVTVTRGSGPARGAVWQAADSTRYVFRLAKTREQAEALARDQLGRVFAVRPSLSMPASEWRTADPDFWEPAPVPRRRR